MLSKRGLSSVVITVLLILIVLAAGIITSGIIFSAINQGSSIELSQKCLNNNITVLSCSNSSEEIRLSVRVNSGQVSRVVGVAEFEDGSSNSSSVDTPQKLSTKQIRIKKSSSQSPKKITVAPAVSDEKGNEFICSQTSVNCDINSLQPIESNLEVYFSDSLNKIYPNEDQQSYWEPAPPLVELAKNEYESFQIILTTEQDTTAKLSISSLTNGIDTIDNSELRIYRIENTKTKSCVGINSNQKTLYSVRNEPGSLWYNCTSQLTVDRDVEIPDPLWLLNKNELDTLTIYNEKNNVYWVTMHAPSTHSNGTYTGEITISQEDEDDKTFPINIEVFNFALPDVPALKTKFPITENIDILKNFYNIDSDSEIKEVALNHYKVLYEHRLSPFYLTPYTDSYTRQSDCNVVNDSSTCQGSCCAGKLECDFSELKNELNSIYAEDIEFNAIGIAPITKIGSAWQCNPRDNNHRANYLNLTEQFYIQATEQLSEYKGSLVALYYDEPAQIRCTGTENESNRVQCLGGEWIWDDTTYWLLTEYPRVINKSGIPTLVTFGSTWTENYVEGRGFEWTDAYMQEYFEGNETINIWVPSYPAVSEESYNFWINRNNLGRESWLYNCCRRSHNPHLIAQPAMYPRAWQWLLWKDGFTGNLEWSKTHWYGYANESMYDRTEVDYSLAPYRNPWENIDCFSGAGACELFYPPCKEGFCPQQGNQNNIDRVVPSIRLEELRDGIEDYEYFHILKELDGNNPSLSRVNDIVVSNVSNPVYHEQFDISDPEKLKEIRREIAREIERLS